MYVAMYVGQHHHRNLYLGIETSTIHSQTHDPARGYARFNDDPRAMATAIRELYSTWRHH